MADQNVLSVSAALMVGTVVSTVAVERSNDLSNWSAAPPGRGHEGAEVREAHDPTLELGADLRQRHRRVRLGRGGLRSPVGLHRADALASGLAGLAQRPRLTGKQEERLAVVLLAHEERARDSERRVADRERDAQAALHPGHDVTCSRVSAPGRRRALPEWPGCDYRKDVRRAL